MLSQLLVQPVCAPIVRPRLRVQVVLDLSLCLAALNQCFSSCVTPNSRMQVALIPHLDLVEQSPSSQAHFNIGGRVFQIPIKCLASERGKTTKLWQAFDNNFDILGHQVEQQLNFDRDGSNFGLLVDHLAGKELQLGNLARNQIISLRDDAVFFHCTHLISAIDSYLAGTVMACGGSHKSESSSPNDEQSSDSELSAQGSWHSISPAPSPLPRPVDSRLQRKRKCSVPQRAIRHYPKFVFEPIRVDPPASPKIEVPTDERDTCGPGLTSPLEAIYPNAKRCGICLTTQSSGRRPTLWRRGPLGPKTLCNNCGIKWYFKQKKAGLLGPPEKRGRKPFVVQSDGDSDGQAGSP